MKIRIEGLADNSEQSVDVSHTGDAAPHAADLHEGPLGPDLVKKIGAGAVGLASDRLHVPVDPVKLENGGLGLVSPSGQDVLHPEGNTEPIAA